MSTTEKLFNLPGTLPRRVLGLGHHMAVAVLPEYKMIARAQPLL